MRFTWAFCLLPVSWAYRLAAINSTGNAYDCAPGNTCPIDIQLAHTFLNFSNIAYCPSASIANWTCPTCQDTAGGFSATWLAAASTFYKVAGYYGVSNTSRMIVIAFRGSTNYRNWIANLNTITTAYPWAPGARVHHGFYSAYVTAFKDILSTAIVRLHQQYPDYKVYVTGHSLGAAMATISAADLSVVSGIPIAGLYTFGSPRVGNLAFSTWFIDQVTKEVFRFTHNRDMVPHVPMYGRHLMKFHHLPQEYWQPSSDPDLITVCDDTGEDRWCADSIRMALSIDDHLNYLGTRMGSHVCIGSGAASSNDEEVMELLTDEAEGRYGLWGYATHGRLVSQEAG